MPNINSLYEEFFALVESGDEAKVREFIVAHFKEFPEDVQDKLTFVFFEEALSANAEDSGVVSDFKNTGLNLLQEMDKVKKDLEDKIKVLDIKSSLDM
jgi:hypothetical protein